MAQSKPLLGEVTNRLHKLTALVPMTDELLEDAPALTSWINRKAPEKIDFKVSDAIINGTGAGMPLGILNSGCLITQAAEGSQAVDTILAMNIFKMYSRMYAPYRGGAVWLIHQDVEPQLFSMTVPVKNVAGTENVGGSVVYVPPGGINGSPYATLMGRPVIPSQSCGTIGDLGDIIFAALPQYWATTKAGGVRSESSIHLFFDYGVTAFRFTFRMGGQPWFKTTIAPKNGSNTLGAFVTLAAR
jgi:HK97 family phage major capsid protein